MLSNLFLTFNTKSDEDKFVVNENYATRIDTDAGRENCVNEAEVSAVGTSKQLKGEQRMIAQCHFSIWLHKYQAYS